MSSRLVNTGEFITGRQIKFWRLERFVFFDSRMHDLDANDVKKDIGNIVNEKISIVSDTNHGKVDRGKKRRKTRKFGQRKKKKRAVLTGSAAKRVVGVATNGQSEKMLPEQRDCEARSRRMNVEGRDSLVKVEYKDLDITEENRRVFDDPLGGCPKINSLEHENLDNAADESDNDGARENTVDKHVPIHCVAKDSLKAMNAENDKGDKILPHQKTAKVRPPPRKRGRPPLTKENQDAPKETVAKVRGGGRPVTVHRTPELYQFTVSPDGLYHCPCCEIKYDSKNRLTRHISFRHQQFECAVCKRQFTKRPYERHRDIIHNDGNGKIPCSYCSMRFYLGIYLQDHIHNMHPEREYLYKKGKKIPCSHCDAKLGSQALLSQHKRQNHEGTVFDCPACDKCFSNEGNIKSQLLSIHPTEAKSLLRQCPFCDHDFATEISLFYHIDSKHEEKSAHIEKPFACSIIHCTKRFRHQISATKHSIRHEGYLETCRNGPRRKRPTEAKPNDESQSIEDESELQCPTCGKLVKASEMKKHEKDHAGYTCSECGKIFKTELNRRQHFSSTHRHFRVKCPFEDCQKSLVRERSSVTLTRFIIGKDINANNAKNHLV